jgi:carboxyl-terminal processing protease
MQMTDRSGRIRIEDVKWRKPVVMLINHGTRSGKEVLAYGFKQYHLGEIIGTQTAGAVLAASAFLMDNGDLLLLAVADVTIDGQRLEGVGVWVCEVPSSASMALITTASCSLESAASAIGW